MNSRLIVKSNWLLIAMFAAALAGCTGNSPPQFRLDMVKVASNQIIPDHQQAIANILDAMFGTPDNPYVLPETGLDVRKLKIASGPVWSDTITGKHGLYRRHCVHCHGISGDGHGPTALIVNPYPRDYRPGVFKFKSTYNPNEPTEDDLRRLLHNGVPGTAMPAFSVLPDDEVDALVEYVKYLAMRGQMETALINYVHENVDYDPATGKGAPFDPAHDAQQRDDITKMLADDVATGWKEASENVILPTAASLPAADRTPDEIAASAALGRELFYGNKANCVKCHGPTALGDGQQDDFDIWSKATFKFEEGNRMLALSIAEINKSAGEKSGEDLETARADLKEKRQELSERKDVANGLLPPMHAIPRNLREGTYRGGRRPLDIFRKVNQGIAGTPMPGLGPASEGAQSTLTEEEMWHIVDYVRSVPFEAASRPPVPRAVNVDARVD